ncbi:hypothetical protein ACFY4K_26370 [Streptomyces leeuwenhoekii]|jgi:hypothetical protein|uniref:Secreted protein n=2 Tax=Streptomyces TaxID=1883 RepID=A0A0C5G294_9ACTN|nr:MULTISPECIES: hypothetical protein [Streptomyces]AJP02670.1 hypothetical protein TU94_15455 [Streptomyces cyaneogriseus subsp. noncyanogenus]KMS71404.1 hypothetical protein ACH49_24645 [Streptomyces leeuwenhoekii]CQR62813.1 Hypothetical Protein sle_33520 [Streptomyces leeuwenhoekii]
MYGTRRFTVMVSVTGMLMAASAGIASAQGGDSDGGPGGLLSNVSGRNSSGHANLCGTGKLALLKDRTCVTEDEGKGGGDRVGPSGGVLSNLVFARNASGHSNNCGNETVSVMSRTTCVTVDRSGH